MINQKYTFCPFIVRNLNYVQEFWKISLDSLFKHLKLKWEITFKLEIWNVEVVRVIQTKLQLIEHLTLKLKDLLNIWMEFAHHPSPSDPHQGNQGEHGTDASDCQIYVILILKIRPKLRELCPWQNFFPKYSMHTSSQVWITPEWVCVMNGNFDCQGHNSPMPGSCSKAWTTSLPSCWTHRRTTWTTLLAAVTIKLRDEQYLN